MIEDLLPWLRATIAKERDEAEQGISDNPPSVVLAQCEAHTALIDFWSSAYSKATDFPGVQWDQVRKNAEWTLKQVAAAYRHSSGYREEWRPSR